MPNLHDTAYPRLKPTVAARDLERIYTPTTDELKLAAQVTKGALAHVGFLVSLKTFQRLGYFVPVAIVPPIIVDHIAHTTGDAMTAADLHGYDRSGSRQRHLTIIREYLQIKPFDQAARRIMVRAMAEAARTKDALPDLINVAIDEFVHQRIEFPVFGVFARAAQHVRATVARTFYRQVVERLSSNLYAKLDGLFVVDPTTQRTPWHALKRDAGNPTLTHLKELADRLTWLQTQNDGAPALAGLPVAKVTHFAAEAATLDAARMVDLTPAKRYPLAVALVARQTARTLDDIAEMLIKRMQAIHKSGKDALLAYHATHLDRTDGLILTLRDLVVAYQAEGTTEQRFAAMQAVLEPRPAEVLRDCDAHLAHAGQNYFPFLWTFYKSHRATLFRILKLVRLHSTSQDTSVEAAIQFLLDHERSTGEWLTVIREEMLPRRIRKIPLLDLRWVPDAWWRVLTNQRTRTPFPERVNRRHFEVCLCSQIFWELKSGDLYIEDSDYFADPRTQQISWDEYAALVTTYGQEVELPIEGPAFVAHVQQGLARQATTTDRAFPTTKPLCTESAAV